MSVSTKQIILQVLETVSKRLEVLQLHIPAGEKQCRIVDSPQFTYSAHASGAGATYQAADPEVEQCTRQVGSTV